jgi:hypothetical protein
VPRPVIPCDFKNLPPCDYGIIAAAIRHLALAERHLAFAESFWHFPFAKVICGSAKGIFILQKRFEGQQKAFPFCKSDLKVSKRHFPFAKVICGSAKGISILQKRFAGQQKTFPLCKSDLQVCIWALRNCTAPGTVWIALSADFPAQLAARIRLFMQVKLDQ